MTTHETTKQLLGEKEVAHQLSCSVSFLRKQRAAKIGPPCLKMGRRVLYPAQALHQYVVGLASQQGV